MWGEIEPCISPASPASPAPCEPHSNVLSEDEDSMDQCASEPSNLTAHVRTFLAPIVHCVYL